jgi:hypothetical protein
LERETEQEDKILYSKDGTAAAVDACVKFFSLSVHYIIWNIIKRFNNAMKAIMIAFTMSTRSFYFCLLHVILYLFLFIAKIEPVISSTRDIMLTNIISPQLYNISDETEIAVKSSMRRDNINPLLVFINKKSGGKEGSRVLSLLRQILPSSQICDLVEQSPLCLLSKYVAYSDRLRILCIGGDGTVGWLVGALHDCNMSHVPIGVIPVGTGNDLVRSLRSSNPNCPNQPHAVRDVYANATRALLCYHSPVYCEMDTWAVSSLPATTPLVTASKKPKQKTLGPKQLYDATKATVKRGNAIVRTRIPHIGRFLRPASESHVINATPALGGRQLVGQTSGIGRQAAKQLAAGAHFVNCIKLGTLRRLQRRHKQPPSSLPSSSAKVMLSYLSFGVDGKVTLAFHRLRNSRPVLFFSPLVNKMWYAVLGLWVLLTSKRDALGAPLQTPGTALGCRSGRKKAVEVLCDGVALTIPDTVESVVLLNVDSYAGGARLWGDGPSTGMKDVASSSASDGLLEVRKLYAVDCF